MATNRPGEWHLPINQTGWHLALTSTGLVKLRPKTPVPEGSVRLYPGMLNAWRWFTKDGALRPEFEGRPVYEGMV
jgi:hypothetical protein